MTNTTHTVLSAVMMSVIASAAMATSVPVLMQAVAAGEPLAGAAVMKEVEPGRVFAGTVKDMTELQGVVAARALRAGIPLQRTQLKVDHAVKRNAAVRFVFKRGGIELAGNGTSLDDGGVGETVRVMNPATRSTLVAVVTGKDQVEMR